MSSINQEEDLEWHGTLADKQLPPAHELFIYAASQSVGLFLQKYINQMKFTLFVTSKSNYLLRRSIPYLQIVYFANHVQLSNEACVLIGVWGKD